MKWILVTNGNRCCIYQFKKSSKELVFLKELSHPESRLQGIDLKTDRPGHYQTSGSARGAYSPHEEPKEHEVQVFLKSISEELNKDKSTNQYDQLILIAPPHVNGSLQKSLSKNVKQSITINLKKDYTHLTTKELLETLQL